MVKVAIIGATGKVGQQAAYAISGIPYIDEMILLGRKGREELLDGITRDITDSFAASGRDVRLKWSTEAKDLAGSDIIIMTAGIPRNANQDRMDLAFENGKIVASTADLVGRIAPESILFMVTNPVDVMTAVALKYSGMMHHRVFGLGTHLDSMRLKSLIARHFNVHVSEVHTRIIGEHGSSMVPLWSATTIGGIQINNLPSFSEIPTEEMIGNVKDAGESIIKKKGATVFGPADAMVAIVRTILGNENRILTVSSYVKSEVHDIGDVCIGVPTRINRNGVFPVPIRIAKDEIDAFKQSTDKIREITNNVLERIEKERNQESGRTDDDAVGLF
jgi:malate dehydrogenase